MIYLSTTIIHNKDRKPIGLIGVAIDITERKRAEESLKLFRTVIDHSNDAIELLDLETGHFLDCNQKAFQELGYTREEFLSKTVFDIDSDITEAIYQERIKMFRDSGGLLFESIHRRKNGHEFPVELNIKYVKLERDYLIVVARNITERKREELIIQQQNIQLQELNATKDKFFSIIAHDLRSPFHGFLGMTEMLTENINEFSIEEIGKYLGELKKSTQNIYTLLQNLLDWAQVQKGSFDFTPAEFSLSATVSASIEQINSRAIQKGITIITDIPEDQKIFVDERMINSILGNLLSNAVKFTGNEGKVAVKAKISNNGMIEISVQDSGVGMPERTLNKLFKIDEKVGRKGTDGELSTGLGLLLCKEFIEKHNGKIWAESEEGKGSTFYFTVPRR